MSSTDSGRKAEQAAATYLRMRGFTVLEQNWRRPHCEVDIIARKHGVVYFVEVKYRKNSAQGGGLDYITDTKLKRMQRGALSWVEEEKFRGEYLLAAVEVGGRDYVVEHFIDNVI
jgi:putative endonuclease